MPTIAHGCFDLATKQPQRFTLVVFYRGLHCHICTAYLRELESLVDAFHERGVGVIAVSADTEDRARQMADKIGASKLRIGYNLNLGTARSWGLYLSDSQGETTIGIEEPPLFFEPGLFLVRPDRTLYWVSVQSMPFARPNFTEMLEALDFAIRSNDPPRGGFAGELPPCNEPHRHRVPALA